MEDIMFVCKYGGDRVAIQYHTCSSYEKLVQVIREKWVNLFNENFQLVYSTPGLDKFMLGDLEDFSSMLRMTSILSMRYVEIDVKAPYANKDKMLLTGGNNNISVANQPSFSSNGVGQSSTAQSIVVQSSNDTPLLSAYWGSGISHVGQVFRGGRFEFRVALAKYAIDRGFSFSYKRNDRTNVIAYCKNKDENSDCPWHVSASLCRLNNYFIIRQFVSTHTCKARLNKEEKLKLSSNLVADLISKPLWGKKRPWAPNDVSDYLKESYGQDVGYTMSRRGLIKEREKKFGNDPDSYQQLLWYTRAARELNPGSNIVLELDDRNGFRRIFVAWAACIEGFEFVRPMLFLDGTHLRGKFKGCLLAATGKNANQELYPLAYAVVVSENADNWFWFLNCLRDVVGFGRPITFISDRNLGLLDALPKVFPESENFFCMRHLEDNLRGRFSGKALKGLKERIVTLFTHCAYAATPAAFNRCLEQFLSEGGTIAENFLQGMPYKNWTNVFSKGHCYGEMTSNAAESFNSCATDARELPIKKCIDMLREKLMLWFNERRNKSAIWNGYLCERMEDELENRISEGRTWRVKNADPLVFQVTYNQTNLVDLNKRTCTCNDWQLKGFPCSHAVASINYSPFHLEDYIEDYWFLENYRKSYEKTIMPIPNAIADQYVLADDPKLYPPSTRRPPGRPKQQRYKTKGEREKTKLIRCSGFPNIPHTINVGVVTVKYWIPCSRVEVSHILIVLLLRVPTPGVDQIMRFELNCARTCSF